MTSTRPSARPSQPIPDISAPEEIATYAHLPVGILVLDERQRVAWVSERFCSLFGCEESAVAGRSLEDLFSPRDRANLFRLFRKMSTRSGSLVDTLALLRIGEQEHFARLRLAREGRRWVVYAENSVEEDDLTYQLTVAQERWLSVYKSSADGVVIVDASGRIVEHNARFFELMHLRSQHGVLLSEEALTGRSLAGFLDSEPFSELCAALTSLASGEGPELSTSTRYGRRFLDIRMRSIRVPVRGLAGACVIIRDVTEERENEELRIRQAQAHFAGMAEVATNILHNLGNICGSVVYTAEELRTVLSQSKVKDLARANELLLERQQQIEACFENDRKGALLPSYYQKLGGALAQENAVLSAQIEDLLNRVRLMKEVIGSQQAYAKGTTLTEESNLSELVEEALKIQLLALERHSVHIERAYGSVGPLRTQRSKLVHVLINLIKNSKEAMDGTPAEERRLTVDIVEADDGGVYLAITDSGEGIEPEQLDKIFAHGFTTKAEGHGFGLHFCATAVEEMGGRLTVESAGPGEGATFRIHFPPSLRPARKSAAD